MMKRLLLSLCLALLSLPTAASPAASPDETVTLAPFGTVTLYHATPRPAHVALFISGDGGWNQGVTAMAQELVSMDTLVAGINIRAYLRARGAKAVRPAGQCLDMAGDLAELGRAVERRFGYPSYVPPALVGYSSGATIVYAALVQAKPHTFRGGLSLGFCPDLRVKPPICEGSGGLGWQKDPQPGLGIDFLASKKLEDPWVVLQGDKDKVCNPEATRAFVATVPRGELVWLPNVGHGYGVPKNWLPQFKDGFARIVGPKR